MGDDDNVDDDDDNDGDDDDDGDLSLPIFLMVSTDCMRPPSSLTCVWGCVFGFQDYMLCIWGCVFGFQDFIFAIWDTIFLCKVIDGGWYL